MGCISSAPKTDTEMDSDSTNNPLVRKITFVMGDGSAAPLRKKVTIKHGSAVEEGDISLVKKGEHLLILGTNAVVDISTCDVIGFLSDAGELVKELSDDIKEICKKYNLTSRV